jgi:glycine/D-amino acid oxidase-like deaminating enzyme
MTRVFEIAVIGGGLAGAAVVDALVERGVGPLVWLAPADDAAASCVPCALVHPFAGRSFQPRPRVFEAWVESCAFFERWAEAAAVHRALLRRRWGGESGARLRASWQRCSPAITAALGEDFVIEQGDDEIVYGPVFAFEPAPLVAALAQRAVAAGVSMRAAKVEALTGVGETWSLRLGEGSLKARHVVVAAGAGTPGLLGEAAGRLELHAGTLRVAGRAPLPAFVVDRGHLASSARTWAWGSSYAPPGASPGDDDAYFAGLRARLAETAADVGEGRRWSGIRLVDRSTRLPWVETLRRGLHVFSAFGSQGGLWIPAAARHLAAQWVARGEVVAWLRAESA